MFKQSEQSRSLRRQLTMTGYQKAGLTSRTASFFRLEGVFSPVYAKASNRLRRVHDRRDRRDIWNVSSRTRILLADAAGSSIVVPGTHGVKS